MAADSPGEGVKDLVAGEGEDDELDGALGCVRKEGEGLGLIWFSGK